MLRVSLPVMENFTWAVASPFLMKHGFDNLIKMAEARSG